MLCTCYVYTYMYTNVGGFLKWKISSAVKQLLGIPYSYMSNTRTTNCNTKIRQKFYIRQYWEIPYTLVCKNIFHSCHLKGKIDKSIYPSFTYIRTSTAEILTAAVNSVCLWPMKLHGIWMQCLLFLQHRWRKDVCKRFAWVWTVLIMRA